MLIAIPLFDRFTALDAVGPFQVLVQLPGATTVFLAERPREITDESGVLSLSAKASFADVPDPDIIVVPGGPGQANQMAGSPLRGSPSTSAHVGAERAAVTYSPSIAELTKRLQVRHHSPVELVNRLVQAGYVRRRRGGQDRREVLLLLTPEGQRGLRALLLHHHTPLRNTGPALIDGPRW